MSLLVCGASGGVLIDVDVAVVSYDLCTRTLPFMEPGSQEPSCPTLNSTLNGTSIFLFSQLSHSTDLMFVYDRLTEVKEMADRIIEMRTTLYDILTKELGSKKEWGHIKSQIG